MGPSAEEEPYVDSWTWYDVGLERLEARTDSKNWKALIDARLCANALKLRVKKPQKCYSSRR